jgi:hypothetical protein
LAACSIARLERDADCRLLLLLVAGVFCCVCRPGVRKRKSAHRTHCSYRY